MRRLLPYFLHHNIFSIGLQGVTVKIHKMFTLDVISCPVVILSMRACGADVIFMQKDRKNIEKGT